MFDCAPRCSEPKLSARFSLSIHRFHRQHNLNVIDSVKELHLRSLGFSCDCCCVTPGTSTTCSLDCICELVSLLDHLQGCCLPLHRLLSDVALSWELVSADRDVYHLVHDFAPGVHLLSPAPSESSAPGVAPNEHVGNLDLLQELQELFLRILHDSWTVCTARRERASTSHDQTALRDLHDLDGGPSTRISDVTSATPEETKTHHLILCASWESDLRDCGTVFNHRSAAMSEFGLIFERCCVAVTSYPQPPLRRGHGCTVGMLTRTRPCDDPIQAG